MVTRVQISNSNITEIRKQIAPLKVVVAISIFFIVTSWKFTLGYVRRC